MQTVTGIPWLTLAIAGVAIVMFAGGNTAVESAALHRTAIVDGEVWRLFTGHVVHYSIAHLRWNLLAFVALGTLVERQLGHAGFARLWLALALGISVCVLACVPAMQTYAGISGINYGLLVLVALQAAKTHGLSVFAALGTIASLASVLFWRQAVAGSPLFTEENSGVQVAWQAHAAGVSAAALFAAQRHYRFGFPRAGSQHDAERVAL